MKCVFFLVILAGQLCAQGEANRSNPLKRAFKWLAGVEDKGTTEAATPPSAATPPEELYRVAPEDMAEARQAKAPVRLQPNNGIHTFNIRGDSNVLAERILEAYGISVVFDADYEPVRNLRFNLENAAFPEAADALQAATGDFLVPVSENMAMVAKDTQQKRQELEHTIAIAIPLPTPLTVQEAQELARSVQQLMEIQKFGIDSANRIAVIRDRVSKALPAAALFRDLLRHRAEAWIEVEYLEVIDSSSLDFGLDWPTSFPIIRLNELFNSPPSIPDALNLLTFGGGKTLFGIGLGTLEAFATFTKGHTRSIQKSDMRAAEGQPVSFHIGDKFPVMTTGYFGATPEPGEEVFTPPPTINFEDLGIVLKITPKIHTSEELTLEIEAEYKVLTGEALNGIPVIANRKITAPARLRVGEAAVIAGIQRSTKSRNITGLAGLANIPLVGYLFRHDNRTEDSGQALVVIRPRLIAAPPGELATREIRTGSDTRPRIPF